MGYKRICDPGCIGSTDLMQLPDAKRMDEGMVAAMQPGAQLPIFPPTEPSQPSGGTGNKMTLEQLYSAALDLSKEYRQELYEALYRLGHRIYK